MIPQQVIEEIKYRNDLSEVIGNYVTLKRAGSNLTGLCPFHSEKTPSFVVFTGAKGSPSFYCFGCGAGGDVISFIMRAENLDYVESLRFLAKRAGIEIQEEERRNETGVKRDRVLAMNREAARFFHNSLKNSSEAQVYLAKRGLSTALIKHFGMGYAPNDFTALTKHLLSKGYKPEEMKAAFLCSVSQKNGRSYDIFRNRIMFPVIDVKGDIIAFGGRTIGNDPNESKYINSSDTPVFNKRRNLFALNFAKSDCAEQLILCEGYMDVVALHGAGFTNAVASLGTALTSDQARLMKRYTKSVVISYDADEAGQRAADKAFGLLGEVGLETRLLKVEDAKDPDEYIKKFGKDAFARLLNRSRSRFDFKFSAILAKYDITRTEDRVKAAADAADFLSGIWSEVERDVYAHQVADKLEIPLDSLKNDIKRKIAKREREAKREKHHEIIRKTEGYGDRVNPDRMNNLGSAGAEDTILGILAMYPEQIPEAKDKVGLSAEDFVTEFNRRVYEKMLEYGSDFDVGLLGDSFSQEEISRVVKNMVARQGLTENGISVVKQCAEKLRHNRQKQSLTLEELIAIKRHKKQD